MQCDVHCSTEMNRRIVILFTNVINEANTGWSERAREKDRERKRCKMRLCAFRMNEWMSGEHIVAELNEISFRRFFSVGVSRIRLRMRCTFDSIATGDD